MPQLLGDGRIMFCTNSSFLALRTNLGKVATVAYYPFRGRRNQPAYLYSFPFREIKRGRGGKLARLERTGVRSCVTAKPAHQNFYLRC
jgi:hypothetical protein